MWEYHFRASGKACKSHYAGFLGHFSHETIFERNIEYSWELVFFNHHELMSVPAD